MGAAPARAQLNPSTIIQNAEKKIDQGAANQQHTQQTINDNLRLTPIEAVGTVLMVHNELVVLNQAVNVDGQVMRVKNKFYLQPSTRKPSEGWKPEPKARVKLLFVKADDGRRMITSIGPP
jgi:hypothetical protein